MKKTKELQLIQIRHVGKRWNSSSEKVICKMPSLCEVFQHARAYRYCICDEAKLGIVPVKLLFSIVLSNQIRVTNAITI